MREELEAKTYEKLLRLCDLLNLAHPATKEDAIMLLLGDCNECLKNLKKNYTVTYIYPAKKEVKVGESKPCVSCNK